MSRVTKGVNDLKTWCLNNGEFGQKLLQEWTGQCVDDNKQYTIGEVAKGSSKKFKWECLKDPSHVWDAKVTDRVCHKSGCPYCSGKTVSDINSLQVWCINQGDYGLQLQQEWTGIIENGNNINIDGISYGSQKRVKWKCSQGHEWVAVIYNRTIRKSKCPYCSGKKVSDANSLKTWCLNNGEFGQKLLQEWTGQCLDDNKYYKVDEISKGSHRKFNWICSKDSSHTWCTTVKNRTSQKQGCPYCSGNKVSDTNSLKTWCLSNGEFGQKLLQEWTGQCLDDNKQYSPYEITRGSYKKFSWKCLKNPSHIWNAAVTDRTSQKQGCPYCSGKRVSDTNSLKTWCLNNGEFGQKLLQEWTGQCIDDNKHYDIDEVAKSSHKKFNWKCLKNHIWCVAIANRTSYKTGCPYCSTCGTSYPEQVLYRSLKQVFPRIIHRGKYMGYEFDITIPEVKTCLEYGAVYHHKDKLDRDNEKKALCKKHGVNLIQVYCHHGDVDSNDIFELNFILYQQPNNSILHDYKLKEIVTYILQQFNHSISEVNFEKACEEAFNFIHDIENNENKISDYIEGGYKNE